MTPLPPQLRYERKFVAHGLSLAEVLAVVRRHPALFHEVYPPRAVNNIYLDSPGLRDYFDHVSGAPSRAKTRVRWYGPLNGHIAQPTLERKIKRGAVSGKLSRALPALCMEGGVCNGALDSALDAAEMPEIERSTLRLRRPSLVNRYQRRYLLSADGRFRLTVDWDLRFFGCGGGTGWSASWSPRRPAVIIELKFEPCHAEAAAAVTNALPFRLARLSKYVLGIEDGAARRTGR